MLYIKSHKHFFDIFTHKCAAVVAFNALWFAIGSDIFCNGARDTERIFGIAYMEATHATISINE